MHGQCQRCKKDNEELYEFEITKGELTKNYRLCRDCSRLYYSALNNKGFELRREDNPQVFSTSKTDLPDQRTVLQSDNSVDTVTQFKDILFDFGKSMLSNRIVLIAIPIIIALIVASIFLLSGTKKLSKQKAESIISDFFNSSTYDTDFESYYDGMSGFDKLYLYDYYIDKYETINFPQKMRKENPDEYAQLVEGWNENNSVEDYMPDNVSIEITNMEDLSDNIEEIYDEYIKYRQKEYYKSKEIKAIYMLGFNFSGVFDSEYTESKGSCPIIYENGEWKMIMRYLYSG